MPGQPVADLECRREGGLERLVDKAGETDERARADLFYRPHPEAVFSKARLEPADERVALIAGQRGDEELYDVGVRVHPGERLPTSEAPRTQQQPVSPQHG